ncbi:MAG: hypothetical protein LBS88_05650 [Tannerellaceae bacterium]|nr:hypothetical protein [Tannerellaceae bacterium]
MKSLDYSDARLFYGEGMPYCDMYSISQLTTIWIANKQMRASMHNLMNRCLSCLNVKATENDTAAIAQLILYYTEGIGTPQSGEMVNYWTAHLNEITKPEVEEIPVVPKRTRQPMKYFVGYNFTLRSPFGITVGGVGERWGWYGRLKSSLSFLNYENEFTGLAPTGIGIPEDIYLRKTGEKKQANSHAATVGLVYRYEPFYFSVGLGYWQRDRVQKYEEFDDVGKGKGIYHFYKVADDSRRGVAADVDCIVEIGKLYITAGCNILGYQNKIENKLGFDLDLNAGMGVFF